MSKSVSLSKVFTDCYGNEWKAKRSKSFDYYSNAFLDCVSKVTTSDSDYDLILKLSKALTGFELLYWNDSHKDEFIDRLAEIKSKLDAYTVTDTLHDHEASVTLATASGLKKTVIFDQSDLSILAQTVKNKINATFNNYGLSISYDEKVQILLSMLEELMEGK